MSSRKVPLITGESYHVFTKSIAGFKIFNNHYEYERMKKLFLYYQFNSTKQQFSHFMREKGENNFRNEFRHHMHNNNKLIQIIAYCLMPTHFHLILKQLVENGITKFMNDILNSYTRFFNSKYRRKGPLWEQVFKNVLIENDEQMLHLTRYIHLNPVTAQLVDKPDDWIYSSYREYLHQIEGEEIQICKYDDLVIIKPNTYKNFVEERIGDQRNLAKIKKLIVE